MNGVITLLYVSLPTFAYMLLSGSVYLYDRGGSSMQKKLAVSGIVVAIVLLALWSLVLFVTM